MTGKFFLWAPDTKLKGRVNSFVLEELADGFVNVYVLECRESARWYEQNGTLVPLVQTDEVAGLTGADKPDTMTP